MRFILVLSMAFSIGVTAHSQSTDTPESTQNSGVMPVENTQATTPVSTEVESKGIQSSGIWIVDFLMKVTLIGSVWVLWLLIFLSVASVTIILERFVFFRKEAFDFSGWTQKLNEALVKNDIDAAKKLCDETNVFETRVAKQGLDSSDQGGSSSDKSMMTQVAIERSAMDKGLTFLGTMGNNAPFIGLFGTVLGIIQAFNGLSENPAGGPSVVMSGISEALIATAVGLFVAIPAVIAYNWFQRMISQRYDNAEAIQNIILQHLNSSK